VSNKNRTSKYCDKDALTIVPHVFGSSFDIECLSLLVGYRTLVKLPVIVTLQSFPGPFIPFCIALVQWSHPIVVYEVECT